MTLGGRLRYARGKETQKALARKMSVSTNTYALYENDKRVPDAEFVKDFCAYTGVDPAWLITGKGVTPECIQIERKTALEAFLHQVEGIQGIHEPDGIQINQDLLRSKELFEALCDVFDFFDEKDNPMMASSPMRATMFILIVDALRKGGVQRSLEFINLMVDGLRRATKVPSVNPESK